MSVRCQESRRKEKGTRLPKKRSFNLLYVLDIYYLRIEILGIGLFLQSVLANHTYTTTVGTLTTIITMMKMTMIIYW